MLHLRRQLAGARADSPLSLSLAVAHHYCLGVQCDGWTDVPGNAIKRRADWKLIGARGFDDQMLFAVHDRFRIGQIREFHTWVWIFGSDCFVAQVEAEAVCAWFADNSCEQ